MSLLESVLLTFVLWTSPAGEWQVIVVDDIGQPVPGIRVDAGDTSLGVTDARGHCPSALESAAEFVVLSYGVEALLGLGDTLSELVDLTAPGRIVRLIVPRPSILRFHPRIDGQPTAAALNLHREALLGPGSVEDSECLALEVPALAAGFREVPIVLRGQSGAFTLRGDRMRSRRFVVPPLAPGETHDAGVIEVLRETTARITVRRPDGSLASGVDVLHETGELPTDANGVAILETFPGDLELKLPRHGVAMSLTIPEAGVETELILPNTRPFAARVVDDDGAPVTDARVQIGFVDRSLLWDFDTRTDDTGRFAFEGLPDGTWILSVSGDDAIDGEWLIDSDRGYPDRFEWARTEQYAPSNRRESPEPPLRSICIRDGTGKEIAGARLERRGGWLFSRSADEYVVASADGFGTRVFTPATLPETVTLLPGRSVHIRWTRDDEPVSVLDRWIDDDHPYCPRGWFGFTAPTFALFDPSVPRGPVAEDDGGVPAFTDVAPGRYRFVLNYVHMDWGYDTVGTTQYPILEQPIEIDERGVVDVELPRPSVRRGTVRLAGQLVREGMLYFHPVGMGGLQIPVPIAADGSYEFRSGFGGEQIVTHRTGPRASRAVIRITLPEDAPSFDLDFPAVPLAGRVVDAEGRPWPGVPVDFRGDTWWERVITDGAGRFQLPHASSGPVRWSMPVMPYGQWAAGEFVHTGTRDVALTTAPTTPVTIRITDPKPDSRLMVEREDSGFLRPVAAGHTQVRVPLPRGEQTLYLHDGTDRWDRLRVVVGETPMVLERSLSSGGSVELGHGSTMIERLNDDDRFAPLTVHRDDDDFDGRVLSMPAGRYRLTLDDERGDVKRRVVDLEVGERIEED